MTEEMDLFDDLSDAEKLQADVFAKIEMLIHEAEECPEWKAEQALRFLRKELMESWDWKEEDCENCERYHSKYKKTKADCIRSMTDEELSSWINDHVDCNRRCEALKDGCMDSDSTCMAAWLEWLKEEAATVVHADNQGGDA